MEVVTSSVVTRMEEAGNSASLQIHRCNIGAFLVIASIASICEVVELRRAAMCSGDDVIGLMSDERDVIRQTAIFTSVRRPFGYCLARQLIDALAHMRL